MQRLFALALLSGLTALLFGCRSSPPTATGAPSTQVAGASQALPSLAEAQQAVQRAPTDIAAQMTLAHVAQQSDPALAARSLRAVLKLDPAHTEAFQALAALYEESNYTDRLLELVEARLKTVPDDVEALLRAVRLYTSIQARSEAEQYMERAVRLRPEDVRVVSAHALFCYQASRLSQGVALLKAYLARHPDLHDLFYRLSELQRANTQYADAEASIRAALRLQPNNPVYHRQLAHILLSNNRFDALLEAEQEARRAVELKDPEVEGYYWLGVALTRQQKRQEALAALEEVARQDVRYDKTAYLLGRLYQQTGKTQQGKDLLKLYDTMETNQKRLTYTVQQLQRYPDRPDEYRHLASIFQAMGDNGKSLLLLRYARRRFPEDAGLRKDLRAVLLASGRKTEAEQMIP